MKLDWVEISSIATVLSTIIIAVTASLALIQFKLMRRDGQFDAARRLVSEIKEPPFMRAWTRVVSELPARMQDPVFRAELTDGHRYSSSARD